MKKFMFKVLVFLGVPIGCLLTINAFYERTNYWKTENNVWKFNFVPENIQLANLGSSHGEVNLKYDIFPQYTTFNFGLSDQRYFWDYGILQQYAKHFAPKAAVLIPISYFGITGRGNYDYLRPRYYRFLKKEYFDQWYLRDEIRYGKIPVLGAGSNVFKCVRDVPAEKIDIFHTRNTFMEGEKLEEYCVERHKNWTNPENDMGEVGYEQNLLEVCQIVEFCLEQGLQPVLITTPITSVLNEICAKDEGFFDTFYQFISDVQTQFPSVPYFDYSHDPEFTNQVELFGDGDHLNVYGAEKFTARVIKDLQEAGLLQTL